MFAAWLVGMRADIDWLDQLEGVERFEEDDVLAPARSDDAIRNRVGMTGSAEATAGPFAPCLE